MTKELFEPHIRCIPGEAVLDGKRLCEICFAPIDNAPKDEWTTYKFHVPVTGDTPVRELVNLLLTGAEVVLRLPSGEKKFLILK